MDENQLKALEKLKLAKLNTPPKGMYIDLSTLKNDNYGRKRNTN